MSATRPGRLVLVGHPVAHSRSPQLQNAALDAAGIAMRYESEDVPAERLVMVLQGLRALRAAGNVTIPHKEAVALLCDRLTPLATRVGAVNTFWHEEDVLWGDNTDVAGFDAMAACVGVSLEGAVVACLGSGGAARAVCAAVERWPGARVQLWGRRPTAATELAAAFPGAVRAFATPHEAVDGCTVVVNATSIGMRDEELPLPPALLPRDVAVMDLVYRPGETRWVREARLRGLRGADGREMLLAQGAAAFSRWFGFVPDVARMRRAVEAAVRVG